MYGFLFLLCRSYVFLFVRLLCFFPTGGKPNHESRKPTKEHVFATRFHALVHDVLEFLEIIPLVHKLSISKTERTILIRLAHTWVLVKRHQAAFTHLICHVSIIQQRIM